MGLLTYTHNNSGNDWVNGAGWEALRAAGWGLDEYTRCDGTIQPYAAYKEFDKRGEGMDEWEALTGGDRYDTGCPCCGPPHSFLWEPDR